LVEETVWLTNFIIELTFWYQRCNIVILFNNKTTIIYIVTILFTMSRLFIIM
jgi:hypothetical protein